MSNQEVRRPMKFPYTVSAQLAQFPYKFYFEKNWNFRYLVFASIICLPVFYKIQKLSYSPENVAKVAEKRRQEREEHHH